MSKGTVNSVQLVGNLGSDPEVRTLPDGKKVANFSIATSESFNRSNGQREDHTEWHRLVLWERLAERAEQYLKKGDKIFVQGSIRSREWEDNQGNKRTSYEIRVFQMEMLGSPSNVAQSNGAPAPAAPAAPTAPTAPAAVTANADDLPF